MSLCNEDISEDKSGCAFQDKKMNETRKNELIT